MRTTLTLDDDVAVLLQRIGRVRKAKLKTLINEALRLGLERMESPQKRQRVYRTPSRSLGQCLLGSLDDVAEALAIGEGDAFR